MRLRVGVVGVGALGIIHARCLSEIPHTELVGVYEHHQDRAERAAEFGARLFDRLDDLLGEVDAVVVSTPTRAHREVAGRALAAGLHCFLEKPMAGSSAECEELLSLARENRRVVHVGHVERMNPAYRAALPYIERPRFIEAHRLATFGPRGIDVDVLLDLMVHDLDLVMEVNQGEPTSISAVGMSVLSGKIDIANARLEFENGCVANLTASRISQDKMRRIRIFQEDAYLALDSMRGVTDVVRADTQAIGEALRTKRGSLAAAEWMAKDLGKFVKRGELPKLEGEPIKLELDAFARDCLGMEIPAGIRPARGEDGRRAVAVAERVRAAAEEKSRQWVG